MNDCAASQQRTGRCGWIISFVAFLIVANQNGSDAFTYTVARIGGARRRQSSSVSDQSVFRRRRQRRKTPRASVLASSSLNVSRSTGAAPSSTPPPDTNGLAQQQQERKERAAARFHTDMRRVLESRRERVLVCPKFSAQSKSFSFSSSGSSSTTAIASNIPRRERPPIIDNDVDGAQRVLAMLQHMVDVGVANEESFQIAMGAILKRGRLRWEDTSSSSGSAAGPDKDAGIRTYDSNNKVPIICAADQLERLLQQLMDYCQANDVNERSADAAISSSISTETYNMVLEAYAVCATPRGDRNYAKRAHALLESMMMQSSKDAPLHNVYSIVHTLHAWAWQQANRQDGMPCAREAQELLQVIQEDDHYQDSLLQDDPDTLLQCHDWVLEAWSKSNSKGSPQRAQAVFLQMKELNATLASMEALNGGNSSAARSRRRRVLNAESYSNVILAWSKCAEPGSAERAHALLEEMIEQYRNGAFPPQSEPELIAFNGCIVAWAKIGRADMAEQILWDMNDVQAQCAKLVPDVVTYNSVLHAQFKMSSSSSFRDGRDKVKSLNRILAIVQHMEDCAEEQPAIAPNSFTYNTLMKAWVESGGPDAPKQAEAILLKMERLANKKNSNVELTSRNFNVVINAYAKSKDRLAASKAYRLLERMEESSQVNPDIISYTTVMECYSKSSDPNASVMAESLLDRAFERYKRTKDPTIMPNLRTFTMAIQALAQCPRQGNAVKARELLTRLSQLYESTQHESLRPNEYPYNYVINCAANTMGTSDDKIRAFQVATRTYQEMRSSPYVNPDSFSYAFWIKACNNLLPEGSELHAKCVSIAFEQCKKDGFVTNEVLLRLQQGSLADVVLQSLLGERVHATRKGQGRFQVQDLPPTWSRSTQQGRSRRWSR